MTRRLNSYSKEKYIHILLRSNLNHSLFIDSNDYNNFLRFLKTKQNQYRFQTLGYALFPSHIHLILENTSNVSFSTILHGLQVLYSKYYHNKYNTSGSLFGSGYKKEVVNSNKDLICHLRYIHQKPKRHGLSQTLHYPYSSYFLYADPTLETFIHRSTLYRLFDQHNDKVASNLFKGIHHEIDTSDVLDISNNLYQKVAIAKKILKEELICYDIEYTSIKSNYNFRENLILKISNESELTHQEIADLLSISRHIVGRIIRLNHSN